MRLLITRPERDAALLADKLAALGHQPISAPLHNIIYAAVDLPAAENIAAVIFTSANGVRAAVRQMDDTHLKKYFEKSVFAVGAATAEAARVAGWCDVRGAGGDVAALAALIGAAAPFPKPLLHIAGRDRAGDLTTLLAASKVAVHRVVLYRAEAIKVWPPKIADALQKDKIDGVLLYSPRAARLFIALSQYIYAHRPPRPTAFCLSDAIADIVCAADYRVRVAATPTENGLLDLLR